MGVILYNLVLILSLPWVLTVFGLRSLFQPEYRIGWFERLGYLSGSWAKRTKSQIRIWVHVASVGEYQAIQPLINLWLREQPQWDLVLSVMTPTGRRLAEERLAAQVRIFFFPIDLPGVAARVLRHLDPDMILLVETELWPNFIQSASRFNVPIILMNGRISQRSYRRYRAVRWLFSETLRRIQTFCMQTTQDAERIIRLGAPPERVNVLGNLKFDQAAIPLSEPERQRLLRLLGWSADEKILVAGSTHEKEEDLLLASYEQVKRQVPDFRLILAPRHLNRLQNLTGLLEKCGKNYIRYSEINSIRSGKEIDILLVDTLGQLGQLYDLGTIAFVGGSLVPVGGHNLLEPAALGRPVLFGPFIHHVDDMAQLLSVSGGGRMVRDSADLTRQIQELLSETDQRQRMAQQARQAVSRHQGVSEKASKVVEQQLQKRSFDRLRHLDFRASLERWFKERLLLSRGGILTSLAAMFLQLLSIGYQGWQEIRVMAYSCGLLRSFHLACPVISIGNLTLGGTGKTPTVMMVAEHFLHKGHRPVILSRGYGRQPGKAMQVISDQMKIDRRPEEAGDEPCLLADRLPGVPILVAADRVAAGRYALHAFQPDVLVMDDGYQHLRLRRDLNLLVVDAVQPFGHGFVFPRGTLREPLRQLKRADAILLTHVSNPAETEELQKVLRRYRPGVPIWTSRYRMMELIHLSTGQPLPFEKVKRSRVMAVAGIGQPSRFFRMLQEKGIPIAVGCIYPDHYPYRLQDLEYLEEEARRLETPKIVTTEKDAVRLKALGKSLESWWSTRVELVIDDCETFQSMMSGVLE